MSRSYTFSFLLLFSAWGSLIGRAQDLRLVLPIGHTDAISSAQFSPDGRLLATASWDGTARIFDVQSGKEVVTLPSHPEELKCAQFSPDNRKVVTASCDSIARIFDAQSGKEAMSLTDHTDELNCAEFSPDNRMVVTASDDSTARIWDLQSGKEVFRCKHAGRVFSAQFSPDNRMIVTASEDSTARIWDAQSGKEHCEPLKHPNGVKSAHFSPDGTRIVSVSRDDTVRIWNARTRKLLLPIPTGDTNWSAKFSPNGKFVAVAGELCATLWDADTGQLLKSFYGHFGMDLAYLRKHEGETWLDEDLWSKFDCFSIFSVDFSADSKHLVTAGCDRTVRIWDVEAANQVIAISGLDKRTRVHRPRTQFLSPDGKVIATTFDDNVVHLWDAFTGEFIDSITDNASLFARPSFDYVHNCVITWFPGRSPLFHNMSTGSRKEPMAIPFFDDRQRSLFISTNQDSLILLDDNSNDVLFSSKTWPFRSGRCQVRLSGDSIWITADQISSSGKAVFSRSYEDGLDDIPHGYANHSDSIEVWDLLSGSKIRTLNDSYSHSNRHLSTSVQVSHDGHFAVVYRGDVLDVWNIESGKRVHSLRGHDGNILKADFAVTGKWLISLGSDLITKVWDLKTGSLLYSLVRFSSGDWLAWDPEYRYDGTPEAIEQMHFACGLEVIGLSQAKDRLKVSNLVSRIMRGEDLSVWRDGLDDLDLCGRTPVVTPLPRDDRGYLFDIEPRKGGVSTCEVYINGVRRLNIPASDLDVLGDGHLLLVVSEEKVAEYASTLDVEVSVIVRTASNLTSRNTNQWVSVDNPRGNSRQGKPAFHGLFVGINDYESERLKLNYAAADARELGQVVEAAAVKMFGADEVHVTTLLSDRATGAVNDPPEKRRVLDELKVIAERSNARDILFIHLAGHGNVNADGEFVFLTSEASSLQDGDYTGVTMREINDALMGVKASQRILILDACHSGEALQDTYGDAPLALARNNDTEEDDVRNRQLERLGDNANMTMLTASASDQKAYELSEIGHGLLTFALLDAIQGHTDILVEGKYLEIKPWVLQAEKTVNARSQETNRQQARPYTPTNYSLGVIDDDVRDLIQIKEKPVIVSLEIDSKDGGHSPLRKELESLLQPPSGTAQGSGLVWNPTHPSGITWKGKAKEINDNRYHVNISAFEGPDNLQIKVKARAVTAQTVVTMITQALLDHTH